VDKIAGYPRWVHKGKDKMLWVVSDGNGFQALRFTDNFKAKHKDLFEDADE
jgi:hypothetical protein